VCGALGQAIKDDVERAHDSISIGSAAHRRAIGLHHPRSQPLRPLVRAGRHDRDALITPATGRSIYDCLTALRY